MKFLCSGCGACCRNVAHLDLPHDGKGVCLNLDTETNQCLIYETRPSVCNVDKLFEEGFASRMSKKDFFIENTKACHQLIDKEGLDESFKIKISEYDNV